MHLLCLIVESVVFVAAIFVVFLSFFVMFLGVSERAKFAAIITKNGHDHQQNIPVCFLY